MQDDRYMAPWRFSPKCVQVACGRQAIPWQSYALLAMAVKVVDASAIAATLLGEAEGEEITARIVNATLVAPALFSMELAQVCLKKRDASRPSKPS